MDIVRRFFKFVDMPDGNSDACWLWKGFLNHGYGKFYANKRYVGAHRWSYEHFRAPIPEGKVIHHICETPRCVNPNHLVVCTQRANLMESGIAIASVNANKEACVNGHPFDENNTYFWNANTRGRGLKRICRACARERRARYRREKRAVMARSAGGAR